MENPELAEDERIEQIGGGYLWYRDVSVISGLKRN
jgi:hypothetical protein